MNQTYVINANIAVDSFDSNLKKNQFKTKLNKLRQRTQLLLQNHSWKKYFNSPSSQHVYTPTATSSSSSLTEVTNEESSINICRNNQNQNMDVDSKSILMVNTKSNSKLNSFFGTKEKQPKMMLTSIENYFLTNSNSHLNLLNETPIMKDEKKSEMDFFETPNSNKKYKVESLFYAETRNYEQQQQFIEINLPQTPRATPLNKMKQQQSLTFIGDMASTSTPTQNVDEPISSTPNASTHNAFKYHPSRTIRNKKLKRKLFTAAAIEIQNKKSKQQKINDLFQKRKLIEIAAKQQEQQAQRQHRRHHRHHHHHHHHHHHQHHEQACQCQNYELKRLTHSSPKYGDKKLKATNIEMRLKDLLYTPNKLKQLIRKQQQHEELKKLKDYYRYKSQLTTPTSTPAKAGALCTSSKIYFL